MMQAATWVRPEPLSPAAGLVGPALWRRIPAGQSWPEGLGLDSTFSRSVREEGDRPCRSLSRDITPRCPNGFVGM